MNTNLIKFQNENIETSKGTGSISTLTFDVDVSIEPNESDNPLAPSHRIFARSPRGKLIECGAVWKKENKETGSVYFTLSIRDYSFNANLGIAAGQDDVSVQAVIPWAPQLKEAA
jgi:uncharacterized protein (DUF736 family)